MTIICIQCISLYLYTCSYCNFNCMSETEMYNQMADKTAAARITSCKRCNIQHMEDTDSNKMKR